MNKKNCFPDSDNGKCLICLNDFHKRNHKNVDLKKIKIIRKGMNVSIKELSKRSGINRSLISLIENDKANPTLKTVESLLKAMDCNLLITL